MRRAQRLRQRREFAAIYRRGRRYGSGLVILRVLPTGGELSRFGFSAGRAVGNAVRRNLVKRRLREAAATLHVEPGWDVVVNARASASEASFAQLREQLYELMSRAGLLRKGDQQG